MSGDLNDGRASVWAASVLKEVFPSGFSKSRSREQRAVEVFWWTRMLSFLGFITFLCPPWVLIVPSPTRVLWPHGSSWIGFFPYTFRVQLLKEFLTFRESLLPTKSTSSFPASLMTSSVSLPSHQTMYGESFVQQFFWASFAWEKENL